MAADGIDPLKTDPEFLLGEMIYSNQDNMPVYATIQEVKSDGKTKKVVQNKPAYYVNKGTAIGTLLARVMPNQFRKNVWLALKTSSGKVVGIPVIKGTFTVTEAVLQKAKAKQKAAVEKAGDENKSFFDKLGDSAASGIKWVAIGGAVFLAWKSGVFSSGSSKSR